MRATLVALMLVSACDPVEDKESRTTTVLSHAGDPDNFTASGFPRHVYAIQNCDYEIRLEHPFQVSEGGWGDADIRVPLKLLDDPSVKEVAEGGPNAQSRVSYAFPSVYRGEGMKEWFQSGAKARTIEPPRPLESAKSTLQTKGDGARGQTHYLGKLPDGREVALSCSPLDWPNPECRSELAIGIKGQRYLITFPPRAIDKLARMVELGDNLFSEAAERCEPR